MRANLLPFFLISLASIALFYESLNYYFFQDDWFVLNWVQNSNVLQLFGLRKDIIYWRPISMPLFFKAGQVLFDQNPVGFHLVLLAFHLINSYLIFQLFQTLKFTRLTALFISFLYVTAAFHFVPLSWISTASYVIGPMFIFLSLIFYLKNKYKPSVIAYLLALASSEFAVVFIFLAAILRPQKVTKLLLPHVALTLIYLLIRFVIFPLPAIGSYEISVTPKLLTNFVWYFTWTFNIPEKISTIFFFSNLKGSITSAAPFLKELIFPLLFFISVLSLALKNGIDKKSVTKGLFIFIFGISPVFFLPQHTYAMYVTLASLGVFYFVGRIVDRLKANRVQVMSTLAIIWFISSFLTLSFTRSTHWVSNLQAVSKAYTQEVKSKTKTPPEGTIFLFKPADVNFARTNSFVLVETEDNVKQSLNDQDAMQALYKDKTLKSVFTTHQKPIKLPENSSVIEVSPSSD